MCATRFRPGFLLAVAFTCAWIGGLPQAQAEQSTINLHATAALMMPVKLELNDIPLRDAVESLAGQAGLRVVWDDAELKEMDFPDEETVAVKTGQKLSLCKALSLVLEPLHLAFEDQGDSIYVTSRQQWDQRVVKMSYGLEVLVPDVFSEKEIMEEMSKLLTSSVDAGVWQQEDSNQSGYMAIVNGRLAVTHRREVQQELAWWLNSLSGGDSR